jgi:hypothetical protein
MWEIRLSGSERGWVTTRAMGEILWHRRETRRQTEKTNVALQPGEFRAYSKPSRPTLATVDPPLPARNCHVIGSEYCESPCHCRL